MSSIFTDGVTPLNKVTMDQLELKVSKGVASGYASLDSGGKIPSAQLPSGIFVPLTSVAAASGVASLDAGTKVPVAQIPDLSATYQARTEKAAASGYASLDATGKVPTAQLPSSISGGVSGDIVWSAAATRVGAVLCDGALYNGTVGTYTPLWTAIGLTYGGSGQASFAVPDLRGRVAVAVGTHADVNALGKNDSVAAANRRPKHRHSPHNHTVAVGNVDGTPVTGVTWNNNLQSSFATSTADGGSGNANDSLDAPAYITLNAFILL